jgi:hypothetical protein
LERKSIFENKYNNFSEQSKNHELELLFQSNDLENQDYKIKNILYNDIMKDPVMKDSDQDTILLKLNKLFDWWKKNCDSKGYFEKESFKKALVDLVGIYINK